MVFDSLLSDGQIAELSNDSNWPFLRDEDPTWPYGGQKLTSTVGVKSIGVRAGVARSVTTEIEALADLEGTITGGGETQPTIRTLKSVVGIRQSVAFDIATLQRLKSVVGVRSVASLTKLKMVSSVVGVRAKSARKIGGRSDWLNSGRYRR